MAIKDSFTPEEWSRLVAAPMVVGIAVTAADPGSLVGAVQESFAVAGAVQQAKAAGVARLLGEIAAAYDSSEGRDMARGVLKEQARGKKPEEIVDAALAEVKQAVGIVAAKAPDAAPAFRDWLKAIADRVAAAGTEGGFLGFGGEKVSAAEKATLERIDTALG